MKDAPELVRFINTATQELGIDAYADDSSSRVHAGRVDRPQLRAVDGGVVSDLVAATAVELVKNGFTAAQLFALRYAWHEGAGTVCAGANVTRRGSKYAINSSTLRALGRRGFVALFIHQDGGMGARLTERGQAVARVLETI